MTSYQCNEISHLWTVVNEAATKFYTTPIAWYKTKEKKMQSKFKKRWMRSRISWQV